MLLLLLSLTAFADDIPEVVADMTIIVEDSIDEEIYVEPTKMICDGECPSKSWIENAIFIEAARKHKSWFKAGTVGAVYNKDTIGLTFDDCDWNRSSLVCGKENGVWVLRSTFIQSSEKASIQLMLFDDNGILIGQGSREETKKTTVVERQRVTQQTGGLSDQTGVVQVCPQDAKSRLTVCPTVPINQQGQQSMWQTEDLEPTVIVEAPVLIQRHISQAMIGVYDSVRK